MKYLKLIILFLAIFMFIPTCVFAEDNSEVTVYFFRGQGCSHCAETEEWFESIEEEYGSRFKIVDYETWYDEDNANLMQKVAKVRGEEEQATGVPYIIIGDKSWIGFTDEYKDEIISQINKLYEQEESERYDVMKYVKSGKSAKKDKSAASDVVSLILILVVCGGIVFGIYNPFPA